MNRVVLEYGSNGEEALERLCTICFDDLLRGHVVPAMGTLNAGLLNLRQSLTSTEWRAAIASQLPQHPILATLHQSPFSARSWSRPRGYSGDAVIIDYIYGLETPTSETALGAELLEYELQTQSCTSVRLRRSIIRKCLQQLFRDKPNAQVLSIASGHLRELDVVDVDGIGANGRITALDQDVLSLENLRARISDRRLQILPMSLAELFSRKYQLGSFDFIYSMGLLDYLDQRLARSLIRYCIDKLNPGGTLLVANFTASLLDAGYMETMMNWWLTYRDEQQMLTLLPNETAKKDLVAKTYRDHHQSIVYLEITRESA